jgi:hypothetical protein
VSLDGGFWALAGGFWALAGGFWALAEEAIARHSPMAKISGRTEVHPC